MIESLDAALPSGSLAPTRIGSQVFCDFSDFGRLDESLRELVLEDPVDIVHMAHHRVIAGTYPLPLLSRIAPDRNVATVLREPRARQLSLYMFLRLSHVMEIWEPWAAEVLITPTRSLEAFLADRRIARLTDNQLCRLVLDQDPRLHDNEFISPSHSVELAQATSERLDRLGYVGLLEHDDIWEGISRFMGVTVKPSYANVSGAEIRQGALPVPSPDMAVVLDLMDERCMVDRIVYESLAARAVGPRRARRAADAAFAAQLVRFGNLMGTSATKVSACQ